MNLRRRTHARRKIRGGPAVIPGVPAVQLQGRCHLEDHFGFSGTLTMSRKSRERGVDEPLRVHVVHGHYSNRSFAP